MDVTETQQITARTIEKVVVHPLVLRNIVDDYNRLAKKSGKRVVGVLLGGSSHGIVDVINSYPGSPLNSLPIFDLTSRFSLRNSGLRKKYIFRFYLSLHRCYISGHCH